MINIKIKNKRDAGFVILFAVTLAALLFAIAIGVTNIAYRELVFGTNARNTNDAFFAADIGAECALFHDKPGGFVFVDGGGTGIACAGRGIDIDGSFPSWTFVIDGLGGRNQSCVKVTVKKNSGKTEIVSKGYDRGVLNWVEQKCNLGPNSIEREIKVTY